MNSSVSERAVNPAIMLLTCMRTKQMRIAIDSERLGGIVLMVSRLRTRLKQYMRTGRTNPAWFAMFAFGRFVMFRDFASRFRSRRWQRKSSHNPTFFPQLSSEKIASSVKDQGVCFGVNLPFDVVDEVLSFAGWTVSLKLRRIDWNLAGVGLACSAVRAPGQGADQVAGDAPAQGGDRPGAMAGQGAGFRGVGVRGAEGGKGFARERGSRRPPGTG